MNPCSRLGHTITHLRGTILMEQLHSHFLIDTILMAELALSPTTFIVPTQVKESTTYHEVLWSTTISYVFCPLTTPPEAATPGCRWARLDTSKPRLDRPARNGWRKKKITSQRQQEWRRAAAAQANRKKSVPKRNEVLLHYITWVCYTT